jgi:uncharacterized membrane protein
MEHIKVVTLSLGALISIEWLKNLFSFAPEITFVIQTVIGCLTIIYLIVKLYKSIFKNEKI